MAARHPSRRLLMLVTTDLLAERSAVVAGPLAPLAMSLAADLDRLLPDEDVFIPTEKARMTRRGGRCARDGAFLAFDPTSPRAHRCPACGTVYQGDEHYRWWIMGYQLWLAERAVHASALSRLGGAARYRRLAEAILTRLSTQYLRWPNEDNVLGPSRPFFSTYLESIWSLQLAASVALLEAGDRSDLGELVRERILVPSSALIASFNEGNSNRQVWNSAVLGMAGVLLDQPALVDRALYGAGGLEWFLRTALLEDGTWYEGENYHLFAHRGLWYLVTLAEHLDATVSSASLRRFEQAFVAPLRTALPDFTFPSRRDSQYRASLRQWRIAESLELGLARTPDSQELANGLAAVYDEAPIGDTARWCSTAEAERNVPGVRLTRANLGWKSLLFALPGVPAKRDAPAGSALMDGQGFGVIRRDSGQVYVALDYGHSGGSHGHPDRLNLWLVNGEQRVFEDVGTGSYVERELHWYRSTLAHNAPLVNGRSQQPTDGVLRAWDEQDGYSWIDAEVPVAEGVLVRRSVVVAEGYLVDRLEWNAGTSITLDLPLHIEGDVEGADWHAAGLSGGSGLEDGFDFVSDAEISKGGSTSRITAPGIDGAVHATSAHDWWRAVAPGPPRKPPRTFLMVRATGGRGSITSVWSWVGPVDLNVRDAGSLALTVGGRQVRHDFSGGTWRVHAADGSTVTLNGQRGARTGVSAQATTTTNRVGIMVPRVRRTITSVGDLTASRKGVRFELGDDHYRGTEASWAEAGSPTALVVVGALERELLIEVSVTAADPNFVEARAENLLDNEHPDVNSDGMQIHLLSGGRSASWIMVPEPGASAVRTSGRDEAAAVPLEASWRRTPSGWELLARIDRSALATPLSVDVIVNQMPRWRERRRGQLVMSGGRGESAYLRGDRQDRDHLVPMVIRDD